MKPDGHYELPDRTHSIERWREPRKNILEHGPFYPLTFREHLDQTVRGVYSISGWSVGGVTTTLDRDELLQKLRAAIDAVDYYGADSYVCDGLLIAIKIIEAGPSADVASLVQDTIGGL